MTSQFAFTDFSFSIAGTSALLTILLAIIIVLTNKELFFETKHVGKLLETQLEQEKINEK